MSDTRSEFRRRPHTLSAKLFRPNVEFFKAFSDVGSQDFLRAPDEASLRSPGSSLEILPSTTSWEPLKSHLHHALEPVSSHLGAPVNP